MKYSLGERKSSLVIHPGNKQKDTIKDSVLFRFPESPIRVFCYPSEDEPQYFFMVKDNLFIK